MKFFQLFNNPYHAYAPLSLRVVTKPYVYFCHQGYVLAGNPYYGIKYKCIDRCPICFHPNYPHKQDRRFLVGAVNNSDNSLGYLEFGDELFWQLQNINIYLGDISKYDVIINLREDFIHVLAKEAKSQLIIPDDKLVELNETLIKFSEPISDSGAYMNLLNIAGFHDDDRIRLLY